MALKFSHLVLNVAKPLELRHIYLTVSGVFQVRETGTLNKPRLRNPSWFTKKTRVVHEDYITKENEEFIKEVVQDRFPERTTGLTSESLETNTEWSPKLQRTGVIARKIGVYPLWFKNGKKISTTLLQVLDNHVIKYYTPEEYDPPRKPIGKIYNRKGALLLGAESASPTEFTKEYCGIFKESGVIPKRVLGRFFVSPDAVLPLGTLITARHFQVGNVVDVRGKTIDRGFQGVMKRHGFSGMPASHGVTKTHRRGGNIGGGGEKGRVWPGTKMPGHMGNRYRVARGLTVLRINTKYNVLWVSGQAIPGETNSIVYVYDTKLPLKKALEPVPFPTFLGPVSEDEPEDLYHKDVHSFGDPTIIFKVVIEKKKKFLMR